MEESWRGSRAEAKEKKAMSATAFSGVEKEMCGRWNLCLTGGGELTA
jgi:hypothetical protein